MGKSQDLVESFDKKLSLSRRTFVKSAAAMSAAAALYGCSKDGDSDIIYSGGGGLNDNTTSEDMFNEAKSKYYYGTSGHNCGGKCIIRAQVVEGRIVRFLTDENTATANGEIIDPENRNCSQSRACPKCRAYKFRLYHPGRLKYPLKQTKTRGDLSGFVRISWDQALNEISRKHKAITTKYGPEAFHSIYACGAYSSSWQGGGYTGIWTGMEGSYAANLLGGYTAYTDDYSFHQNSFFGGYTGVPGANGSSADDMAGVGKNVVLWGSNILTTVNPRAYSWVKSLEDMKKRNNSAKVTFIGPEFVDTGVTVADKWIQMKPYTDTAVILGMLHHMISKTFNTDGSIKSGKLLDLDYLDTMVYGFFDSPEYWINKLQYTDGTDTNIGGKTKNPDFMKIVFANPGNDWTKEDAGKDGEGKQQFYWAHTGGTDEATGDDVAATGEVNIRVKPIDMVGEEKDYKGVWTKKGSVRWYNSAGNYAYQANTPASVKVDAISGNSLSAYIMGDDIRLQNADYSDAANKSYMATQFAAQGFKRNNAASTYATKSGSKYLYKKDLGVAKTPEWAAKISGVPAATIKELAELYAKPANHPIYSEWCGAQQKQAEGVTNMFAMQTLMAVTKSWGQTCDGLSRSGIAPVQASTSGTVSPSIKRDNSVTDIQSVVPSVTQWHNAIKMAFGDELKASGKYTGKYIPDWSADNIGKGKVYHDDGGAKALVKWKRTNGKNVDVDPAGYYVWEKGPDNNPLYSGFRFILNSGGNILMNQHMNPNDSREMFEALPVSSTNPDDADTLCLVTFDNFMAPSARWSDYVLPAATNWEQQDAIGITFGNTLYIPEVIKAPGEAKSQWNFTNSLLKAYEQVDSTKAGIAAKFTGGVPDQQIEDLTKISFEKAKKDSSSPYYGKTWDEFLEKPYLPRVPSTQTTTSIGKSGLRSALDTYLASTDRATKPFTSSVDTASAYSTGYGHLGQDDFINPEECPNPSGRFHVFCGSLSWRYANRYNKWHGFLPQAEQGQKNTDAEGDPIVWNIPIYFNYEDYFREAYGLPDTEGLKGRYLLTTTHDRYRAHSSQSENPYLRELTHRTAGGKIYSGNDHNSYARMGAIAESDGVANDTAIGNVDPLNGLINANGVGAKNASYSEIWINPDNVDGVADGDLIQIENEVGTVRCVARTSYRCVPGFLGLHQGCWYDPREIDGKTIDVGGCCNTLMATKPSRIDHGNGQQSAMVKITIVEKANNN